MKILPRASLAAIATVAALGLAACGNTAAPSASDTASAEAENAITLYSGRNENLVQPIIDKFTAETGIPVNVRYDSTAAMAAQLLEEGERSPADIFLAQDAGALGAVSDAGLFEALPKTVLDEVPEAYRDTDGEWVGVTARARVLVYNKDLVSEADLPASVEQLNDPKHKGQLGVAPTNASFQSFVTALRVLKGEEAAKQYLADLAANDPQIREGNAVIVADVNDGKIPFGLVNHYYMYELAQERGVAPAELNVANHFFPGGDAGSLVNVSGAGLIKHSDNDDAARLLEYLLSAEGQTYFAEGTHEYPLVDGIAGPEGLPALSELEVPPVNLNDLKDLQTTIQMITEAGLA